MSEFVSYPYFENVRSLTGRHFAVAFNGDSQKIGYIDNIIVQEGRNIFKRYELGSEEISYLAPGSSINTQLTINKIMIVGKNNTLEHAMYDGYSSDKRKYDPSRPYIISLLDFYSAFDINVFMYNQDTQLFEQYMIFKECWIKDRSFEIKTDNGAFNPIIEKVLVDYTYITV